MHHALLALARGGVERDLPEIGLSGRLDGSRPVAVRVGRILEKAIPLVRFDRNELLPARCRPRRSSRISRQVGHGRRVTCKGLPFLGANPVLRDGARNSESA